MLTRRIENEFSIKPKPTIRATSIMLVAVIVLCCMVIPVSAAEVDNDNFLNVLDYAFTNETGTNAFTFTGSGMFSYTLPQTTYVGYVDMVICTGSTTVSNIAYRRSSSASTESLNITSIGTRYIRVYGTVTGARTSTIYFDVTGSSSSSTVVLNVVSLRVGRIGLDSQEDKVQISLLDTEAQYTTYQGDDNPVVLVTSGSYANFSGNLWCLNWERYDYFDFYLVINASAINSIYAVCGGYDVPLDISYIDNGGSGDSYYNIMIRIYFTGLDRTGADPMVYITGVSTYSGGTFGLISAVGHIETETVSVDTYWYNKLYKELKTGFSDLNTAFSSYISDLKSSMISEFEKVGLTLNNIDASLGNFSTSFLSYGNLMINSLDNYFSTLDERLVRISDTIASAIEGMETELSSRIASFHASVSSYFSRVINILTPDTTSSEELKEEVEEQASELDQITDVLDDVSTPEIVQDDLDINIYIDTNGYASFTSVITEIFKCNIIYSSIMMALIFALGAYLLYGKR